MNVPIIAAIAAMSRNRVIGKDNKIPWHISEDFKHFKRVTMGKPIIMGRKTYESLGRALPGRVNIVISSQPENIAGDVVAVATIEEAVVKAKDIAVRDGLDEIFIIGGAQIYKAAFPLTQRFYLTLIDQDYEGDAFLDLDFSGWTEVSNQPVVDTPPYAFKVFERN